MRSSKVVGLVVAFVLVGLLSWGAGMSFANTGAEPGSPDDPLVTQSYVEQLIRGAGGNPSGGGGSGFALVVEELQPGERLLGEAGTEMTVRSGYAKVIGKNDEGKNLGLNNVTAGTRLLDGLSVPREHQLVVPRTDGRGLVAEERSGNMVTVMVRGAYVIQ